MSTPTDDMTQKLRGLTRGNKKSAANRLMKAIIAGIVNWEVNFEQAGYTGKVEAGEILTHRERVDLARGICNSLRALD